MSSKRLMIIGAGILQIPAIEISREMGLYTIVSDYNENAPGMALAHQKVIMSTRDIEGSVRIARLINEEKKIHGVITVGTDASATVAAVANALGLPGIRFFDAYAATNKILMRERFAKHGVSQPNFFPAWTTQDAENAFSSLKKPVVVKPADNMGARGVTKVEDIDALANAFEHAKESSPSGEVIIEEYMKGAELSIDMLVYNGETFVTGVADRVIEREPYFIETGHILPSSLKKEQIEDAVSVMKAGVKALNINFGAAKGDIKITDEGAKVGEIAARLSGGFMSAYTYPYASGVNLTKAAIEIALGEAPSNLTPKWSKVSVEKAILPGNGYVRYIRGVRDALAISGVKNIFIKVKPGDFLPKPTNNLEKAGNVIVVGNNQEEALRIADEAIKTIDIGLSDTPVESLV